MGKVVSGGYVLGLIATLLLVLVIGVPWVLIVLTPVTIVFGALFYILELLAYGFSKITGLTQRQRTVHALLVDDDPSSLLILEQILKENNIDFKVLNSGTQVSQAIKEEAYDFMILDYDMPGLNGPLSLINADQRLKDYDVEKKIPVIGYSSYDQVRWSLPRLRHFQFLGVMSKGSPPSRLRKELARIYAELEQGRKFRPEPALI